MSWDVLLLRLSPDINNASELSDEGGEPLGSTAEVRRVLSGVLPNLDLSDPTWAILEGEDFSIEFSIGLDEPCDSIMLHVRGLDEAIQPIQAVCSAMGLRALDFSSGEFIDFNVDPAQGLRAWREFREKSGSAGPIKGTSLTTPEGNRVFFDGLQPKAEPSKQPPKRKPWWQFW